MFLQTSKGNINEKQITAVELAKTDIAWEVDSTTVPQISQLTTYGSNMVVSIGDSEFIILSIL